MLKFDLRRDFVKIAAGTGAASAMPNLGHGAVSAKMIGIQVGAVSFVDEGTEKVLDVLQERARVNTLFLAVFTYGRGIADRQIPGQPLPYHGIRSQFSRRKFRHPTSQHYKDTVLTTTLKPAEEWLSSRRSLRVRKSSNQPSYHKNSLTFR